VERAPASTDSTLTALKTTSWTRTDQSQRVIQESIAEFTLAHSINSALNMAIPPVEYSTTVTKSGTNNWHGTAWEYNRNRQLRRAF